MPLRGGDRVRTVLADRSDKLVRGLALETARRLIQRTPVDTGRARANWNLATGAPDASTSEATDPSGAVTVSDAQARAAVLEAGEVVYVTNALDYIPPLEDGHSKQAPQGFIGVTAVELQGLADKIARSLRGEP